MPETILILEDELIIARSIQLHLEANGYSAFVATAPEEAQQLIDHHDFDLVLSDINLQHRIDGISFVKQFVPHRTPVIFLSAYSDVQTLQEAELVMPYAYLLKPFHKEQLLLTIKLSLGHARKKILPVDMATRKDIDRIELSNRELDIVRLIAQGKSSVDIADLLFISRETVSTHRRNILRKTGSKNALELSALALEKGWL